uniref:Histone-lysine N-methyltransferase ATX2-like isoform X1 n=1 Tax=Tanacetum cinerariifolium TaxID=118510 RepID=A0A6L2P3B2_TANCI|nr:histone-lysine N-methyltransferase ATX2-like isoform X1 [Tanacetum cinerariifolium]
MVHARCYGELEPDDGVLWLCNLCRPGAPEVSPPCCLCPLQNWLLWVFLPHLHFARGRPYLRYLVMLPVQKWNL